MPKVIYKNKEGALHIGGGRFFYANEPVEVPEEEKEQLLADYDDLEEIVEEEIVEEEENETEKPKHKNKKDDK